MKRKEIMNMHTYVHTYTHTHTCTNIHTYVCTLKEEENKPRKIILRGN